MLWQCGPGDHGCQNTLATGDIAGYFEISLANMAAYNNN